MTKWRCMCVSWLITGAPCPVDGSHTKWCDRGQPCRDLFGHTNTTLLLSHTQSDKRWRPVYRFQMRCVIDALAFVSTTFETHSFGSSVSFLFLSQERVRFSQMNERWSWHQCALHATTARNWNAAFASQLIVLLHSCVLLTFDVLPCHKHIERWQSINGHSLY